MNIKKTFNELNKYIFKKETKNFSKIIIDQGIVSGGNFFTTLILFKFLGLEDFGIFTAIWILIISTNTVQESLIVSPLLSIAPKLKLKKRNEYISNLKFLQLIFSSFTSLIILIIIFFAQNTLKLQNVDGFLLINIFISIPLIQYGEFCRRAIYISSSVEHLTLIDLSKYITQITLFIICFNLGFKSEKNILFIYSISSLSTILLSIKYIPNLEINIKSLIKTFERNWVISKWLLSTSVIQWIQNNYLLFLSNVLLGPIALGVIKVFQSILGISHIFLQSISSWLPVKTSKELVNNPWNFKKNISKVILIFWIILSSIFILIIAFSKIILSIYDGSIVEYNNIFILYVFSYIIMSLNNPVKAVLVGIEKTFSSFLSIFLSASIIILLGYPLVKTLGLSGTALTLISSQLIIFTTNIFFLKRNLYKIQ